MFDKIAGIISEYQGIEKEKIKMDTHLINDLALSSFDIIELVSAFEEELGVEISDEHIVEFRQIGDLVEYIENRA